MIKAKCIQKFRDDRGTLRGYRLQYENGQMHDVTSDALKQAIKNKQIEVVNLTLTSDNRLIDSATPKELSQPKAVSNKYIDIVKALILLDKELLDMGDSYQELVYNLSQAANLGVSAFNYQGDALTELHIKSYITLLETNKSFVLDCMNYYVTDDSQQVLERNIQYENVSNINSSNIYKAICTVLKYLKDTGASRKLERRYREFTQRLKTSCVAAINIGYQIGHCYFQYLDNRVFGTISNNVFTVGHTITSSDTREFKDYRGYSYVCHKDINICGAPRVAIAALFKNGERGSVLVDFKLARQGYLGQSASCVGLVGYIKNLDSLTVSINTPVEVSAREVAGVFNKLGQKLYNFADANPLLYSYKAFGAPLESISIEKVNMTNTEMIDSVVDRITKVLNHEPAKVCKSSEDGAYLIKRLYSNLVGSDDVKGNILVKFNNGHFSISIVDMNAKITFAVESCDLDGEIKNNSMLVQEVATKLIISARFIQRK